jgi:hypothetical protein
VSYTGSIYGFIPAFVLLSIPRLPVELIKINTIFTKYLQFANIRWCLVRAFPRIKIEKGFTKALYKSALQKSFTKELYKRAINKEPYIKGHQPKRAISLKESSAVSP